MTMLCLLTMNKQQVIIIIARRSAMFHDGADPGEYLHQAILQEMGRNIHGLKAKLLKLNEYIRGGNPLLLFRKDCRQLTKEYVKFATAHVNWNSSQFASITLMYLTTAAEDGHYKKHVANFCLRENPNVFLDHLRRSTAAIDAYEIAVNKVEKGYNLILGISIFDGKAKEGDQLTYEHSLVMSISVTGIYIYQAYSCVGTGQGYTFLEYLQAHPTILSHSKGRLFVQKVTRWMQLSVDDKGRWSQEANDLYKELFEVDLVTMGHMKLGAKFDPYLLVEMHHFSVKVISENLELLPQCHVVLQEKDLIEITKELSHPLHSDDEQLVHDIYLKLANIDDDTSVKIPCFIDYPKNRIDYADPILETCIYCNFSSSCGISKCSRCNHVSYCCYEHENRDLHLHKDDCSAWIWKHEKRLMPRRSIVGST